MEGERERRREGERENELAYVHRIEREKRRNIEKGRI